MPHSCSSEPPPKSPIPLPSTMQEPHMMRVSFDAVKGGKLKEMWVVCAARGLP